MIDDSVAHRKAYFHSTLTCTALRTATCRHLYRREDAKGVMQYMQQVQAAGLEADDPLASYMLQVGAGVAWWVPLWLDGCCVGLTVWWVQ
jgi:hypothetical protein